MYVRNCYSRLFQSFFMLLMLDILILQSAKIIENGPLHFNFVSDPCLPETIELNWKCIEYALSHQDLLAVGFSLTGCDDLEPGASPNDQRIWAMQVLHNAGVKTWASIEPIIDPVKSFEMIERTIEFCDHYKQIRVALGRDVCGLTQQVTVNRII